MGDVLPRSPFKVNKDYSDKPLTCDIISDSLWSVEFIVVFIIVLVIVIFICGFFFIKIIKRNKKVKEITKANNKKNIMNEEIKP